MRKIIMSEHGSRREFLKRSSLLPLLAVAGQGLLGAASARAQRPITRVGGSKLKLSLNAYSFNSITAKNEG